MKRSRRWLTYLVAAVIAVAIALMCVSFQMETVEATPAYWMQFLSNGFFLSAVLYLGCGALTLIADAGNFYGIQFLGYTLVRLFSFRKDRFEGRKDYFTYCTEKKAKREEKGSASSKWVLLQVGLGCLVLSVLFTLLFYRMIPVG